MAADTVEYRTDTIRPLLLRVRASITGTPRPVPGAAHLASIRRSGKDLSPPKLRHVFETLRLRVDACQDDPLESSLESSAERLVSPYSSGTEEESSPPPYYIAYVS